MLARDLPQLSVRCWLRYEGGNMGGNILIGRVGTGLALMLALVACSAGSVSGTGTSSSTTSRSASTFLPSHAPLPASSAKAPAAVTSAAKAPPSWASVFKRVSTGVVRIDDVCNTSGFNSIGTGTGFLIGPNLVATVAHVVEDGGALRVTSPTSGVVEPAQVIGYDHDDDLALLRTAEPIRGHVFRISRNAPEIGTEIAAIGFPLAQSMQLTTGNINGIHDHREVGKEFDLSDVLLSDVALNPGNSGGPWITNAGVVVALSESGPPYDVQDKSRAQGNNGGVSAADALSEFSSWRSSPRPQSGRSCQPANDVVAATETLDLYLYEINQSDYASAYAQLYSGNHPISGLSSFIDGVQSSTDAAPDGSGAAFLLVDSGHHAGNVYLDVRFRSHQHAAQGPRGETCTDWTLRYEFRPFDASYRRLQLIYATPATPGTPGSHACSAR